MHGFCISDDEQTVKFVLPQPFRGTLTLTIHKYAQGPLGQRRRIFMKRTLGGIALISLLAAAPVLAADYREDGSGLRPAYPDDWQAGEDNPLRFEAGLRYWYSLGEQWSELGGETFSTKDTSHILEGHFRIDDDYTSTFLKGQAGYAGLVSGEYQADGARVGSFEGGQVGYAGADFGWTPLGTEQFRLGLLAGYQFHRESPDRNRLDVDSIVGLNIHELRLGVTGHADFGMFDIDAEVAAIPYAYAEGTTAQRIIPDVNYGTFTANRQVIAATGALYGAHGQVMLGFHPTENLTVRVGGRAWVLSGPSSMTVREFNASDPDTYAYSDQALSGFYLLRYGALAELTGRF